MSPRIVVFAGPPPPSSVTDSTCTLTTYIPPFTSFLNIAQPSRQTQQVPEPSSPPLQLAAWRSLPLIRQPLHTGFTQHNYPPSYRAIHHPGFFSTADTSLYGDATASLDEEAASQEALTQFIEASLSALEETSLLDSFETSFLSTSSAADPSQHHSQQDQRLPPPHLSDLEDVPSPKQILALHLATVTLNLIISILSVSAPRTIHTRFGHQISLVEVLVGDNTRSGFTVTFWIPPSQLSSHPATSLRRQEVVLLQNVALHVFRGKVYGQSLRKGLTKVSLLWSPHRVGAYSARALAKAKKPEGKDDPQLEKTRLVRDWGLNFVGADPGVNTRSKQKLRSWDEPPPDSQ